MKKTLWPDYKNKEDGENGRLHSHKMENTRVNKAACRVAG